jgi:FkbM family methyltransferase
VQGMSITNRLARLVRVAAYNKNWFYYLPLFDVGDATGEQRFHLRNGQVIDVRRDGRFVLNEIYLDRVYDLPGRPWAGMSHVLDLGANIGLFASYVASQSSGATIHCFEPARENFEILERNIERNGINARLYDCALTVDDGVGFLSHEGSSVEYGLVENESDATEQVKCLAMTRVFEVCEVEHFDLLKIDIEGFEKQLISAASDEWLGRFQNVVMEWHHGREELEGIKNRFREMGYDAQTIYEEGQMPFLRAMRGV